MSGYIIPCVTKDKFGLEIQPLVMYNVKVIYILSVILLIEVYTLMCPVILDSLPHLACNYDFVGWVKLHYAAQVLFTFATHFDQLKLADPG